MNQFLKEKYELFLFSLAIIFIIIVIFLFLQVNKFLIVNLDKALSIPEISKEVIDFNIEDATIILKKRNLIE